MFTNGKHPAVQFHEDINRLMGLEDELEGIHERQPGQPSAAVTARVGDVADRGGDPAGDNTRLSAPHTFAGQRQLFISKATGETTKL